MERKHGRSHVRNDRTYHAWKGARQRCRNPRAPRYRDYGGRGLMFSKQWDDFHAFLAEMGECPVGHSLERRDNNRGYEPGNCYWATRKQQARNKRDNVPVTVNGETHALAEWAERLGIPYQRLWQRVRRLGYVSECAVAEGNLQHRHDITCYGRTQGIAAWARELRCDRALIRYHLARGPSVEEAFHRIRGPRHNGGRPRG